MHTVPEIIISRNGSSEAPCSLNARVEVDGLCVQVTGRGATPDEAVAHFRGTLAALRTPDVSAPPSRQAQIATLLTCGLAKATAAQDWPLVQRLAKAAALVLSDGVELSERPGCLTVRSQSYLAASYEVDGKRCTCPDNQRHHEEYVCKHILAAAMWQRLR